MIINSPIEPTVLNCLKEPLNQLRSSGLIPILINSAVLNSLNSPKEPIAHRPMIISRPILVNSLEQDLWQLLVCSRCQ